MTTDTLNVERIEVSNQLMNAAEQFDQESTAPIGPAAQAECKRIAGTLATIARALLNGQADLDRAIAYLDAGHRLLVDVVAKRRLIEEILNEWKRA